MYLPKIVKLGILAIGIGITAPVSAAEGEKCEVHAWVITQNFFREWAMAAYPGQAAAPISDLTGTIASRTDAVLTAGNQIEMAKKEGLPTYFPSESHDVHYDGNLTREEFAAAWQGKRRLRDSSSNCYVDFIILYNRYEDMMFGSRRLYTAITVRDFTGGKLKARTKEMIDPLNLIDDLYRNGDIPGMDREISASFSNNLREFFVEAPKRKGQR